MNVFKHCRHHIPFHTCKASISVIPPYKGLSTITRLAVPNTATEILKTHGRPIEFSDIVSLAAQLEKWDLGK